MSEILGYDCNGKALRAGDRAEIVNSAPAKMEFIGREVTLLDLPLQFGEYIQIDIPYSGNGADWYAISAKDLKRKGDQECGDWSEIEKATGWNPEAVPA